MTIVELKAQAYDALAQIEAYQMKLREINQQIITEVNKEKNLGDKSTDIHIT